MHKRNATVASLIAIIALASSIPAWSAQLQILMPLGRTVYQTNETIDVSAVRSDTQSLAAGSLVMNVTGADGSKLSFTFPVEAVAAAGGSARATENLHIDGWLLRPGKYTIEVDSDGATATTPITVYSAVRKSTYKTIHWGGPGGDAMVPEGENGMGFNVILTQSIHDQTPSIAAGVDIMGDCIMGGGHQMDLKGADDWSDPSVYIGAIQRGADAAFSFRTLPNAIGAHLYDEPGLTWLTNPHTGVFGDQDIPPQRDAYQRAYGREAIWSDQLKHDDPQQYAQWTEQNDFKLGFMDAFWKSSVESLKRLKPDYDVITQSEYGWSALFDGYYFNVVRSMPIISGHGGYDNYDLRNFNPSWFLEMSLARDFNRPNWYLPEWDGSMSPAEFELEHNLSFITGIQGMSAPPSVSINCAAAPGVTASNKLYSRIGTIFTVPEHTYAPLSILYSKSDQYYNAAEGQSGLMTVYMVTKLLQYPVDEVLEEDVLDGTLAMTHKAVILTGLNHLDPPVVAGLEAFIKQGGVVLETKDCTVSVDGAIALPSNPEIQWMTELLNPKTPKDEAAKIQTFSNILSLARPMAAAIKAALANTDVRPAFVSSVPTIAAGHQERGDIDYTFAVNFATQDDSSGLGAPQATTATITLPDNGRPVYDAVAGKMMAFKNGSATLTFAPGQMYVFARPVRPIGGVQLGVPVVTCDYTRDANPIQLDISGTLVDTQQRLIAGNAPMEVKITDPLHVVRYDLYRCAEHGLLDVTLPLAANDPAGAWTVTVAELLSGTSATSTFTYQPAPACGAAAGSTHRAVVYQYDRPNIFQFFRDHRNVTVVAGSSDYDQAAAQRLITILAPYDVNATIESMSDADQARTLTDAQVATWCGGEYYGGTLTADQRKDPSLVGYNLPGPTILIGNAADNPLIAFMEKKQVLPYTPSADFPGAGHGMVAWNEMCLGHDIEALALIGDDAAGVNEAVGTAFEIGIGIDPLTPYALPIASSVTPASFIQVTQPK